MVEKEHGFAFLSPRYFLQVASDQPPRVELVSPATNLVALVGRPVNFSARISDDHGIDSSVVKYRVNSREEESFSIVTPLDNQGTEQPVDWDYRKTLPDLKIGDTVSFTLQVADKYPDGPHIARLIQEGSPFSQGMTTWNRLEEKLIVSSPAFKALIVSNAVHLKA